MTTELRIGNWVNQPQLPHIAKITAIDYSGDDKYCHYYQNWHDNFIPPYSINFNMNERK